MSAEGRKVTTIGGGTGGPIAIEALNRTAEKTGGKIQINVIAPTFDSGGATGNDRASSHGTKVAQSDALRNFLALPELVEQATPAYTSAREMLLWRDPRSGEVLGQKILHAALHPVTGYAKFEKWMGNFGLDFNGHHVIPASTESSNIVWTNDEGTVYIGEHFLDNQGMSKKKVKHMELNPPAKAFPKATESILESDDVLVAPGSLFGSLLSCYLAEGMKEAMIESKAKLTVIINLTTTANETRGLKPKHYIKLYKKYAGKKPDVLVVPEMTREKFEREHPRTARSYKRERSRFLNWTEKDYKNAREAGVEIVLHNATEVVLPKRKEGEKKKAYKKRPGYIRHNPERLADTLARILPPISR